MRLIKMNKEIEKKNEDANLDEDYRDFLITMIMSSILFLIVVFVAYLFGIDILKILEDSLKI
jgi:hypothetical protein